MSQNDTPAAERSCYAHGCPELGTITDSVKPTSSATWLCRAHYGHDPHDWDVITRKLRVHNFATQTAHDPYARLTPAECRERIKQILASPKPDPKDWARMLRMREESGETLSTMQRKAWREALGVEDGSGAEVVR